MRSANRVCVAFATSASFFGSGFALVVEMPEDGAEFFAFAAPELAGFAAGFGVGVAANFGAGFAAGFGVGFAAGLGAGLGVEDAAFGADVDMPTPSHRKNETIRDPAQNLAFDPRGVLGSATHSSAPE